MPNLFNRTGSSASAAPQLPSLDDEADSANSDRRQSTVENAVPNGAVRRRGRAMSAAGGLSSSFSLPSRSYIHHAGYGSQEPVHYSSSGVREQTIQLSSSFLSDSEFSRPASAERSSLEPAAVQTRQHGTIEERSEPGTPLGIPAGSSRDGPLASQLTAGLRKQAPQERLSRSRGAAEMPPPQVRTQSPVPSVVVSNEEGQVTEVTPLLPRERQPSRQPDTEANRGDNEDDGDSGYEVGKWNYLGHHYPSIRSARKRLRQVPLNPRNWDYKDLSRKIVIEPIFLLQPVFLGLLLNLLDALSYGIILFPLGEEAFKAMGPDGVSMFYVSCILSQIVYSSGSIFRGAVGSEMIEVVPFFHKMTYLIMGKMGTDDPDALRATVITSYAMSSIMTGAVFFGLGATKFGTLVNFFPNSILMGCIGGVGIFLFVTGIEVSARLDGNLEASVSVVKKLFETDTVVLWIPPLILAISFLTIKRFYDRHWLTAAFYLGITALFYTITTPITSISMEGLRSHGWVFEAPAAGVTFYHFYSYYNFSLVNWSAILATIPSQLALTFFGILHVPINIPSLAMVVQEDNVSINRELILHGLSNTISGAVGSIQNYLVFVNSALFMQTGGNRRLAGYMLAAATFGLWIIGPIIIGYVPVMVVGTLIYQLGMDLTIDALVKTYGKLHWTEHCVIVAIALIMGLYDFVVGIAMGIGLACIVYVVQTSKSSVIRAEFSGATAESTVRRHPRARKYLQLPQVANQVRIFKLSSYLFFGSIVNVEKQVRAQVDADAFARSPIRYLILEFTHVSGLDFSAAGAFLRMNRILHGREVKLILAGITNVERSLSMVGLFEKSTDDPPVPAPKVFETLNNALEACENEMLMVLSNKEKQGSPDAGHTPPVSVPEHSTELPIEQLDSLVGSPRRDLLRQAATTTITESPVPEPGRWQNFNQPLPLLLKAFDELTTKNETFWQRAVPYFAKRQFIKGQKLYGRGDKPDGFYLLESGMFRCEYDLEQGSYNESIVAGTTCGELPFFSETKRTSSVIAELDCVAWLLTPEKWEELQQREGDVAMELLKVGMKLSAERMDSITKYVLITAS